MRNVHHAGSPIIQRHISKLPVLYSYPGTAVNPYLQSNDRQLDSGYCSLGVNLVMPRWIWKSILRINMIANRQYKNEVVELRIDLLINP